MRQSKLFIAFALCVSPLLGGEGEAAAQVGAREDVGVYQETPQSLEQAQRDGRGIRISGNVRQRVIPRTYTVRQGDTLWDVTGRYYGNPWQWPRVWSYNPEVTNPHWIYPHDQLRLMPPGAQMVTGGGSHVVAPVQSMTSGTVHLRQQGYLDHEALQETGTIAGAPEDHMLLAPFDLVYIEFSEDLETEPSGEMTIFREIPSADREEGEEGTLVRVYGAVRIESYDRDRHRARATIIEALDPIERGFLVAPIPRRFDMVPPQAAAADLETHVAATLRPRELLGDQQIVFVPVGRENGVQLGNRFFVIRAGDRWRDSLHASTARDMGAITNPPPEPEEYPAEVIAEARVVDVRDQSATLMVTRSVSEVSVGDRIETRQGY